MTLSTQYCLRYAGGVTDLDAETSPSPTTRAALAALAGQAIEPEMEQLRLHIAEMLAPILAEATESMRDHIAVTIAPLLDEAVRGAGFQESIAEAARAIALRAGVVQAVENSGYRSALYALAAEHHGYVTTEMAKAIGVPSVEVRKLAARGGMSNIARGLYRVDGIDGGERAPYAEAVLRVGADAHLLGHSVLALHDLALVNPSRIKVGTARRVRRDLPASVQLVHTRIDPGDLTEYDNIPSVTVTHAIRDSVGSVMPARLAEALERAVDEGLVRRRDAGLLRSEIGAAA